jgi:type VI secretion system protein ImpG
MDPRLLRHYDQELRFVREMGAEFAAEFPKIAGRLGIEAFECADPYVERLLEGFAFLAARVQVKLEAEFPTFTQHLFEIVYPHYLAPTPSMVVANFRPNMQGGFENGYVVPRDTTLLGTVAKDEVTSCEFRTAHEVTLWPVQLVEADYLSGSAAISALNLADTRGARAALRLRLRTLGQVPFAALSLQSLAFYLQGPTELPALLLEQLLASAIGMIVRPTARPAPWQDFISKSQIRHRGLADADALLPYGPRSFQGYRLLAEYFAFPERDLFVTLGGLGPAIRRTTGPELEILILLNREDKVLGRGVSAENMLLNCTPAINLFPKRLDRIQLSDRTYEHHVLPDRTRPLDFEVYQLLQVSGQSSDAAREQEFLPLYARSDLTRDTDHGAYYTLRRQARILSSKEKRSGARTNYIGSETFLSLVDSKEAPWRGELRQLSLRGLCTNRDLPLLMPIGKGRTDFTLEIGAPVDAIRCLAGPTRPRPSRAYGETAWRLISHLSLNYLSISDEGGEKGAAALRQLLSLYADTSDAATGKQIDGLKTIGSQPIIRRLPGAGQTAIARGLEVAVTFDETAFQGFGVFVLGMVLAEFFAKYVSINSFTETAIRTVDRGEVMRWPMTIGRRHTL